MSPDSGDSRRGPRSNTNWTEQERRLDTRKTSETQPRGIPADLRDDRPRQGRLRPPSDKSTTVSAPPQATSRSDTASKERKQRPGASDARSTSETQMRGVPADLRDDRPRQGRLNPPSGTPTAVAGGTGAGPRSTSQTKTRQTAPGLKETNPRLVDPRMTYVRMTQMDGPALNPVFLRRRANAAATVQAVWTVLLTGLAFGAYFVLRYQGYWSEIDTSVFLTATQRYTLAGSLTYPQPYLHGFAYISWISALSGFTGLPVALLVQVYLPMIGCVTVAFLAFAAFRQLLGSERLSAIAAGTLFLIPELVYTITRGNHEKVDISMILLALLALLHSFREATGQRRWGVFVGWALTFHVAVYTLLTSNTFFGSTFSAAMTLTLLGAFLILKRYPAGRGRQGPVAARLSFTVAICWALVALVMWYVYPSASTQLQTYKSLFSRLSALFLSFDTGSNPYVRVSQEWASPLVYRLISSFRWVLFLGSAALWIIQLRRMLARLDRTPVRRVLLLSLYGSFGMLLALSIPVDFLGLAEGSNLQVRLYTYFALFATPVFVAGTVPALRLLNWRRLGRGRRALRWPGVAVRVTMLGFAVVSLLKATVDPQVSNLWIFYRPQEVVAMTFFTNHATGQSLWIGPRERLTYAFALTKSAFTVNGDVFTNSLGTPEDKLALSSNVIRAHAVADQTPLPTILLGSRVYDNGEAQIYRRLPLLPFER